MENNSDKEMRDKLRSTEFPFDPKAWEQMESMLDEDRKPRAFFWWWFGGVAACLLLATGMLGFYQFEAHQSTGNASLALNKTTNNNTAPATNFKTEASTENESSSNVNSTNHVTPLANTANRNDGFNSSNSVQSLNSGSGSIVDSKGFSKTGKNRKTSKAKSRDTKKPATNTFAKSGNGLSAGNRHNKANKSGTNVQRERLAENKPTKPNNSNANEILAQTIGSNERAKLLDPISIDPILAFEFPSANQNDEEGMKKKDEGDVNLKKLKKKFFVYSLGIAADITGATLGHQTGATVNDAFNRTPSYMAGLTHDFMFFKRFAITNSILFSQTSFNVLAAKTTYPIGLSSYASNITEMAIPIGVKGYAISKPKFRFYLGAGVINHIKFKETFNYQYNNNNVATNLTGGLLPAQTPFTGGGQFDAFYNSNTPNSNYYKSTYDVSINHGSRYYTSFYASAGADFIVKKHYVFFAESLFDMALQKVGVQDKYKYNVGLSCGFRYQF